MATFRERLHEAMTVRNIKAAELSRRTGIDRGSISYYCSGKYEAAQGNLYKLAQALGVDEGWLMGYDVPMNRTTIFSPNHTKEANELYSKYCSADPKTQTIVRMMLGMENGSLQ